MAKKAPAARSPSPSKVTVTFSPAPACETPRRGRLVAIVPRGARVALASALALVVLGAIIPAALQVGGRARQISARAAHAQSPEAVRSADRLAIAAGGAIASAFGYPYLRRCLTVTISATNPAFARVDINRSAGCGRYRGYVNASFHLVGGGWRLVLEKGQLLVPSSLLAPCVGGGAGCGSGRPANPESSEDAHSFGL